ncbi:MAG: hypothetical protein IT341_09245 [Chloroflexi bacterium]|nr:hypothetical protein [Chloroflexota bacterium]
MNGPGERPRGPGGGPSAQHYQFYASWVEDGIPFEVSAAAPAWAQRVRQVAARLVGSDSPAFAPPEPQSDAETRAALERRVRDRLPMLVDPRGVHFADAVLLLEHTGAPLSAELNIGHRGDRFSVTGWVAAEHVSALRACSGVSPGLQVRRARIRQMSPGMFACAVSESVLFELSAVRTPARPGTGLLVAACPGVEVWAPPEGERYSRQEPVGARWRALSDEGEEAFQAAQAERQVAELRIPQALNRRTGH